MFIIFESNDLDKVRSCDEKVSQERALTLRTSLYLTCTSCTDLLASTRYNDEMLPLLTLQALFFQAIYQSINIGYLLLEV